MCILLTTDWNCIAICKQKASFTFRTATRFSLSGDAFLKKYNRNPVHTPCEGGGSGLAGMIWAYKRVKITACFDKSFPICGGKCPVIFSDPAFYPSFLSGMFQNGEVFGLS